MDRDANQKVEQPRAQLAACRILGQGVNHSRQGPLEGLSMSSKMIYECWMNDDERIHFGLCRRVITPVVLSVGELVSQV